MTTLQGWLCQSLSPPLRQFLANLSVFPGSFTARGAAAVNEGMQEDKDVEKLLRLLGSMSLIQHQAVGAADSKTDAEKTVRYSMHALIQHAARSQEDADGGHSNTVSRRFTAWMLQHPEGPGRTLLRCRPSGSAPDPLLCQSLLQQELQNFGAAAEKLERELLAAGADDSALAAPGSPATRPHTVGTPK